MLHVMTAAILSSGMTAAAPDPKKMKCEAASVYQAFDALYSIKAAQPSDRVFFHKEPRACPAKGACTFRDKSSVGPGDQVLVGGPESGDFRCAAFGSSSGALSVGFIPKASLERVEQDETDLSPSFLQGSWLSGTDSIDMERRGDDMIKATGNASAKGATSGNAELNMDARVGGKEIIFIEDAHDDSSCRVTLRRRGPYVFASDNAHCGEPGARFEGIYVKVTDKKPD